ncbi:MAG: stalk domain-containing protein [Clostridiales bacterium]|nr:stalk domain-containing protein [Clostridiales bacterium]
METRRKTAFRWSTALLSALLAVLLLTLSAALPALAADTVLVITGDGVDRELSFSLDELKGMTGYITQNAYSAWNTWPAKSVQYARGVSLKELLSRAGLKEAATAVTVAEASSPSGAAGYSMRFLLDDLFAERYYFEGAGSAGSAVPAILAFMHSEKSFAAMAEINLQLIYGQLDAQEQTTVGFVKSVSVITVTCDPVFPLPPPEANAEKQPDGSYLVTLSSANRNAKIYYTTDGSLPTVHSKMYNVSAPHWQPELNLPFAVSASAKVKAIAVATGYQNSEVMEFIPAPPVPEAPEAPEAHETPSTAAGGAAGEIQVVIDGKRIDFDVPPRNVNGRILVPLRAIFEELGATIEYDSHTKTVTAVKSGVTVILTIGDTYPTIDGRTVAIDQPGVLIDGRTLAPLRFVAEAFGGAVVWDGNLQLASIESKS